MRTVWWWGVIAAAIVWYAVEARREQARRPARPEGEPAPGLWEEANAWQVLAPRHRGGSPAPLIVLVTPGWLGPVEVLIETPRAREVLVTRARGIPWPARLPALAIGEWCTVVVRGVHGRAAEACYVRVLTPPVTGPAEPDGLATGLPAAACLRGGREGALGQLRAGVDRLPDSGISGTMRPPGSEQGRAFGRR